jgi:hypothetical protein
VVEGGPITGGSGEHDGLLGDDGQAATLLPGGGGLRCHDAAEGRVLLQYSDNILGPAVIASQWINSGSVTGGIKRMSVRDRALEPGTVNITTPYVLRALESRS